jgi:RNA polymerase sigma factor (sigma-70 family)
LAESEDLHIIKGCLNEDRQAQNALYRMYYSYGMNILCRYFSDKSEATIVLNDAFLKVYTNLKSYNSDLDFKPWFKTIIINTAINHIKKMKKFSNEVDVDDYKSLSVSETILSKINFNEIVEMVQSLTVAYRTVFNLYVLDGYKHEEIADQLGITVSTSKSNLARAKEKLREKIVSKQLI